MIDISDFKGESPKLSDKLLPDNYSTLAINCELQDGRLGPVKENLPVATIEDGIETIYRLGEKWLQWSNKVNVVESLVHDSGGRIIFTGDDYPKETDISLGIGVTEPYPTETRRLGISAPTTAPSYSITVTGTGTDRSVSYCYTRIGEWEDGTVVESAPSPATVVFTAKDDATVRLTGFTDASETGVYTTDYRIYRINTGDTGAEYQYVDDLDKTTSPLQYDDDHSVNTDDDLGEVLPTTDWAAPVDGLQGIILGPGGLYFAFDKNTVYATETFISYAFPYSLSVSSEVVGLGYNGTAVVVLTKTFPFLIYGSDPDALSLEKKSIDRPCKSARSVISIDDGVIYASDMGIVLVDSSGNTNNITRNIFTKDEWAALGPENIFSFYHNDTYLAFWSGSTLGIEFNLQKNEIRRFNTDTAVFGGQYVSTVNLNTYDFLTSGGDNFITSDGHQMVVSGDSYSLTYDTLYLIQDKNVSSTLTTPTIVNDVNTVVSSGTVTVTDLGGGTGTLGAAYSTTAAPTGYAGLSFKVSQTDANATIGLNTDASTDYWLHNIDFAWRLYSNGTAEINESSMSSTEPDEGTQLYTTDTEFKIIYDGLSVKYYMDDHLKHTSSKTIEDDWVFYFDCTLYGFGTAVTDITFGATVVSTDREIVSWNSGDPIEYSWKSKDFYSSLYKTYTAGIVVGDFTEGATTLEFYVDDTLVLTKSVSNQDVFRIPGMRGSEFQVKLEGKASIDRVIIGESIQEVLGKAYGG